MGLADIIVSEDRIGFDRPGMSITLDGLEKRDAVSGRGSFGRAPQRVAGQLRQYLAGGRAPDLRELLHSLEHVVVEGGGSTHSVHVATDAELADLEVGFLQGGPGGPGHCPTTAKRICTPPWS